jgi:hypothetical protein
MPAGALHYKRFGHATREEQLDMTVRGSPTAKEALNHRR